MPRRDGESWSVTDTEIERLCAYIRDDSTIAAYTGASRERVADVRLRMPERGLANHHARTHKRYNTKRSEPESQERTGDGSFLIAKAKAADGSAMLLEQIARFYRVFEHRHGLDPGEGLVVNLYGWDALEAARRAA